MEGGTRALALALGRFRNKHGQAGVSDLDLGGWRAAVIGGLGFGRSSARLGPAGAPGLLLGSRFSPVYSLKFYCVLWYSPRETQQQPQLHPTRPALWEAAPAPAPATCTCTCPLHAPSPPEWNRLEQARPARHYPLMPSTTVYQFYVHQDNRLGGLARSKIQHRPDCSAADQVNKLE